MKLKKTVFLILLTVMIGFEFSNIYGYSTLMPREISWQYNIGLKSENWNKDTIKNEIDLFTNFRTKVHQWLNTVEQGQESENGKNIVETALQKLEKESSSKYLMDHITKQFNSIQGNDKKAILYMIVDLDNIIRDYQAQYTRMLEKNK